MIRPPGSPGAPSCLTEGRHSCRPFRWFLAVTLLCLGTMVGHSVAPTLDHIHPAGFARGTTNIVKMAGKVDPWPPQVWVAGDDVQITALTNKNELQFVVVADASPGARLFRLFNAEGASEPQLFVVSDRHELAESEPNDQFTEPMPVDELPLTINGRLDKSGDVDSFRVRVPAGHKLIAAVDSYVLMSKLDAVLRLATTNGQQLAWNHDFATIDPKLEWQTAVDTEVVVQVFGFAFPATASIQLTGGEGAIYRLHLSVDEPGSEPASTRPSELSLPGSLHAFIDEPGALHRFKLKLAKDEWISAGVAAESLGSPLDAWLAVENGEGKELTRNDDADGSRDPALDWKAPEDGEFALVVGSLTRNAGPDQLYELNAKRTTPDWQASLSASSLAAKPGTTNELKLTFTRLRGFTNEIQVVAATLPDGVTCEPVTVPEKSGEVTLNLISAKNTPEWQGPIQFFAHDTVADTRRVIPFKLTATSVNNGVPGGYRVLLIDELDHTWLTVLPKGEENKSEEAK